MSYSLDLDKSKECTISQCHLFHIRYLSTYPTCIKHNNHSCFTHQNILNTLINWLIGREMIEKIISEKKKQKKKKKKKKKNRKTLNQYIRTVLGPAEIDGLPVPPGKAYTLLTDHLITG